MTFIRLNFESQIQAKAEPVHLMLELNQGEVYNHDYLEKDRNEIPHSSPACIAPDFEDVRAEPYVGAVDS